LRYIFCSAACRAAKVLSRLNTRCTASSWLSSGCCIHVAAARCATLSLMGDAVSQLRHWLSPRRSNLCPHPCPVRSLFAVSQWCQILSEPVKEKANHMNNLRPINRCGSRVLGMVFKVILDLFNEQAPSLMLPAAGGLLHGDLEIAKLVLDLLPGQHMQAAR
jgi:hypothetical protein